MTLLLVLSVLGGEALAAQPTAVWLGCGMGMFLLGWAIQFVGHYYEGRKPAFVGSGLLIGLIFVTAEIAFLSSSAQGYDAYDRFSKVSNHAEVFPNYI